LKNTEPI